MSNSLATLMKPTVRLHLGESMTDDTRHPADATDHPDNQQQAVEACQHATDALETGPQDPA